MSRFVRVAIVCALVLGVAGIALGQETKEEKMTVDETQESYQRKSITYLGIVPKVAVPDEDGGRDWSGPAAEPAARALQAVAGDGHPRGHTGSPAVPRV